MDEKVLEILGKQHDFVFTMYEFHPEAFEALSDEDLQLLQDVYFLNREIDVESVDDHIEQHVQDDAEVISRLSGAIEKLAVELELSEDMKRDLLPKI